MNLAVRQSSPSPRFSGVEIQYKYAPEHPGKPEFIESVTFEVVPDEVFKGVRSKSATTNLDEVPSEAADTLTKAGKTLKDPRSTAGNGIPWYKPEALQSLLEQVVDDSGFWPSHLYPLTHMVLAYGLNAQGGEAHYDTEVKTFHTKEDGETTATPKQYTVAQLTVDNPFLIRREQFFTTQLPRADEIDNIQTLVWSSNPRQGREKIVRVNLPDVLLKRNKPADDDGPETAEYHTIQATS